MENLSKQFPVWNLGEKLRTRVTNQIGNCGPNYQKFPMWTSDSTQIQNWLQSQLDQELDPKKAKLRIKNLANSPQQW